MSSPRFAVPSPRVIYDEWTLGDLADAHITLDLLEELERKAARP